MKYLKQYTLLAIAVSLSFAACKKSSDTTPANSTIITTTKDTMGATINGNLWTINTYSFGLVSSGGVGNLEIGGTDSTGVNGIDITLNDYVENPKTYTITANGTDSANFYYNGGERHHATKGTVKIIAVTDKYIQGTFEFTADSYVITSGVFNYKL